MPSGKYGAGRFHIKIKHYVYVKQLYYIIILLLNQPSSKLIHINSIHRSCEFSRDSIVVSFRFAVMLIHINSIHSSCELSRDSIVVSFRFVVMFQNTIVCLAVGTLNNVSINVA